MTITGNTDSAKVQIRKPQVFFEMLIIVLGKKPNQIKDNKPQATIVINFAFFSIVI